MTAFVEALSPRFSLVGQVVEVPTIAIPLVYVFLPLLAGLIAHRERWLGAILFVLLPLLPTLVGISERWDIDGHAIHPFNFESYFMVGLYSVPAFLVGLFGRQIGRIISKYG